MQLKAGAATFLFLFVGIVFAEIYEPFQEDSAAAASVEDVSNNGLPSSASQVSEGPEEIDHGINLQQIPVSKPLGEVSAVAIDSNGNLIAFHRGDRIWDKE